MNNLIGHQSIFKELKNLYISNNFPKQILLNGKSGIGKSILVKELLFFIFKDLQNSKNLILNNSHPNIFTIKKNDDKKVVEINQIREMIQFHNNSSFFEKPKVIIIKDLEYLNHNSLNALLKVLEQPNQKTIFLLINNSDFKVLETIKSRCIEFKLYLTNDETKKIVDSNFDDNMYDKISDDFINKYSSPSFIISLTKHFIDNNLDISGVKIESFILSLIAKKNYKTDIFIKENINYFIELFFYKNISSIPYKIKKYFLYKLNDVKKYNLDLESYLYEFEEKLLSG